MKEWNSMSGKCPKLPTEIPDENTNDEENFQLKT
ncbi:hypothetical protein SAMN05421841_4075 [Chryseobacterium wanjuense]|jgi:hypothetical protein|uniref:Uncharacterized protein n=1 Tax=Chryseobacterium wanjuense TaxID=356305 RepID=A0A1I0S3K5_9FLAO|nr:hypothetical protein SAMN05421841_4075 [Chryseobacterium wanjuense]